MSPGFHPYRRKVEFTDCVEAPIRPLIDELDFIDDKRRWGYRFRFGLFRIDRHDFELIRAAMTAPR
jgi:predicted RNA-binding protein